MKAPQHAKSHMGSLLPAPGEEVLMTGEGDEWCPLSPGNDGSDMAQSVSREDSDGTVIRDPMGVPKSPRKELEPCCASIVWIHLRSCAVFKVS